MTLSLDRFSVPLAGERGRVSCYHGSSCLDYDVDDGCDGPYPAKSPDDYSPCFISRECQKCGNGDYDPNDRKCPKCGHKVGTKS